MVGRGPLRIFAASITSHGGDTNMNEYTPKPKPPVSKTQPKPQQVRKPAPKAQKKPFSLKEHLTDRPFSNIDVLKELRKQVKEGEN